MIRDAYKKLYGNVEPGRALIKRTIAAAERRAKKSRRRTRIVLIPLVAILLLGFAYAATQSQFLKWVFGPVEVMPEAREMVDAVGQQVRGEYVSAAIDEVFFDGHSGIVQWNISVDSDQPLIVMRSQLWSKDYDLATGKRQDTQSVFEYVTAERYIAETGIREQDPHIASPALLGGERPHDFRGAGRFTLYEDMFSENPKEVVLAAPTEIEVSFLVLRPKVPCFKELLYEMEDLPPRAMLEWDDTLVQFVYDIERKIETYTYEETEGWWGDRPAPGETKTVEFVDYEGLWLGGITVDPEAVLEPLGMLEEFNTLIRGVHSDATEAEKLRWYGKLLEHMDFGEVVEEVSLTIPLSPKSILPVGTEIVGGNTFEFDFFRAEITSADFNPLGGEIQIKLWPDYEKADPRIRWSYTNFDVFAYRDGEQIGDQAANFFHPLTGNLPEPWFEEPPKSEVFEATLRIAPVPTYPDTLVIVPHFAKVDSWDEPLDIPGDHSMTIQLREP